MKRRPLAAAATALIAAALMTFSASAETKIQDGLKITMKTDMKEYTGSDSISVTVEICNSNSYDISGMSVEQIIPAGYQLAEGSAAAEKITLAQNETKQYSFVLEKEKAETPAEEETVKPVQQETTNTYSPVYSLTPASSNAAAGTSGEKTTEDPQLSAGTEQTSKDPQPSDDTAQTAEEQQDSDTGISEEETVSPADDSADTGTDINIDTNDTDDTDTVVAADDDEAEDTAIGSESSISGKSGEDAANVEADSNPHTGTEIVAEIAIVIGLAAVLFLCIKTKKGRNILSLFLCAAILAGSAYGLKIEASAVGSSGQTETEVATFISIDGAEQKLTCTVEYDAINDGSIYDIFTSQAHFVAGDADEVTVTVYYTGSGELTLYSDKHGILGTMINNGDNGVSEDSDADNNEYSLEFTVNEPLPTDFHIYAQAPEGKSASLKFIVFPDEFSEDAFDELDDISYEMGQLARPFVNEEGYQIPGKLDEAMDVLTNYVNDMYKAGNVLDYDILDDSIEIKLKSGLKYSFGIPEEGKAGGGYSPTTIYHLFPYNNQVNWGTATANHFKNKIAYGDRDSRTSDVFFQLEEKGEVTNVVKLDNEVGLDAFSKYFSANSITIWNGHGKGADFFGGPSLGIGTFKNDEAGRDKLYNSMEKSWKQIVKTFLSFDFYLGKAEEGEYYTITAYPLYIKGYLRNLSGSIVYLSACNSIQKKWTGGYYTQLAEVFTKAGAIACIGNTRSVNIGETVDCSYNTLMNLASGDTLEAALNKAYKEVASKSTDKDGFPKPIIYGKTSVISNYTLDEKFRPYYEINLTVTDESGKAIPNCKVISAAMADINNKEHLDASGMVMNKYRDTDGTTNANGIIKVNALRNAETGILLQCAGYEDKLITYNDGKLDGKAVSTGSNKVTMTSIAAKQTVKITVYSTLLNNYSTTKYPMSDITIKCGDTSFKTDANGVATITIPKKSTNTTITLTGDNINDKSVTITPSDTQKTVSVEPISCSLTYSYDPDRDITGGSTVYTTYGEKVSIPLAADPESLRKYGFTFTTSEVISPTSHTKTYTISNIGVGAYSFNITSFITSGSVSAGTSGIFSKSNRSVVV